MENPYEKFGAHPCRIQLPSWGAWSVLIFFAAILFTPPIYHHAHEWGKEKAARWLPVVEFWNKGGERTQNHFFNKKSKN
ncbi:MAG: hypothetical protein AAF226_11080, partial [Verrucomicrobiota bacterium]